MGEQFDADTIAGVENSLKSAFKRRCEYCLLRDSTDYCAFCFSTRSQFVASKRNRIPTGEDRNTVKLLGRTLADWEEYVK